MAKRKENSHSFPEYGNGHMVLPLRGKKFYVVYGGPYRSRPTNTDTIGVKMAAEIDRPVDVDIPTVDFSTPPKHLLDAGLIKAVKYMVKGEVLYVGCMAGQGRTGLFLAILAKAFGIKNPVEYVRGHYYAHAVETPEQYNFISNYEIPQEVVRELRWAKFFSVFKLKKCLTNTEN